MKSSTKLWLILIFAIVLALRLYLAFQTTELNYEAYGIARQVEHITDTGMPLFQDDLSYGGRIHLFSPVYHYFLALFNLVLPLSIVLKLIPNILASLLILVVFHLANYLIKNEKLSLLAAVFAGFIPVFFNTTINNASINSAIVPLFFLTTYYFLQTNKDSKYFSKLIVTMVTLTFLSPYSLILAVSLLIYLILIKVQHFRESKRETEVVLFFTFLVFWINMILFKKALALHGGSVVWQNIPTQIIQNSFAELTFLQSIYAIGVIPLLFGLASIYLGLFSSKRKTVTLMMSIALTIFFALWFRLIELTTGLVFLGVALTVLSIYSLNNVYVVAKSTRLKNAQVFLILVVLVLLIATFIPNLSFASTQASIIPGPKDIDAFIWLENNTDTDDTVIVLPEEGSALSHFSMRKNVMDEYYILIRNINSRYEDVTRVYSDKFLTTALERLNYYSVDYLLLTEKNGLENNITGIEYEGDCVEAVYPLNATSPPIIYRVNCVLVNR